MKWHILNDGNLKFTVDKDEQAHIAELIEDARDRPIIEDEVLEDVGALTDAEMLTNHDQYEHGSDNIPENMSLWWYPNYQVRSFTEDLAETGETVFKRG